MIMSKGSILTISLKPHLADFCRHEMRQDKDNVAKDMIYIQTKPIDPVELADKGSITEEEKPF